MYLIAFLMIGMFCGGLTNYFVGDRGLGGSFDVIVGVVGAFVGGFFFDIFKIQNFSFWAPFWTSLFGSIAFLSLASIIFETAQSFRHRAH